ncbi:MAG: hypothetical protein AABY22_32200 [Nanoarchaeota archaeon]
MTDKQFLEQSLVESNLIRKLDPVKETKLNFDVDSKFDEIKEKNKIKEKIINQIKL